jgi:hypothetical protein
MSVMNPTAPVVGISLKEPLRAVPGGRGRFANEGGRGTAVGHLPGPAQQYSAAQTQQPGCRGEMTLNRFQSISEVVVKDSAGAM